MILILISCKQAKQKKAIAELYKDSSSLSLLKNCRDKQLYFIGTHHVGTKKYYDSIKSTIDSLNNYGYVLYYEGIFDDTKSKGFLERRMVIKKYAEIMGNLFNISQKNEAITEKIDSLISQPKAEFFINDSLDVNADVSVSQIVEYYEKTYGNVNKDITKQKNYKSIRNDIVRNFREKNLIQKIINSKHDKIVILFGSNHKKNLKKLLKKDCKKDN
jgi:hypothetical protein